MQRDRKVEPVRTAFHSCLMKAKICGVVTLVGCFTIAVALGLILGTLALEMGFRAWRRLYSDPIDWYEAKCDSKLQMLEW